MNRRKMMIRVVVLLLVVAGILTACGSDDGSDSGFVHIEEGGTETAEAQTAVAMVTPTESSPTTPVPTAAPYAIPTDSPDIDPETVITRVGSEDITLEDYRKRVRFERYRYLYPIVKLAEKYGTEELFDLTNDSNWYLSSVFATLADSYSFGSQVHRVMVIESIAEQEARRRGMEVNPQRFDSTVAQWLGLQVGAAGQMPPEFDQRYAEFIDGIDTYANMSEEEFRRIIRDQTLYNQLKYEIQLETEIDASGETVVGVTMQDMIVTSESEAEIIAQRLAEGESLFEIAVSLGYAPSGDDIERVIRLGGEDLPSSVIDMIFDAKQGDVLGPVFVIDGWYVGKVGTQVIDMLNPEDIDALREDNFLKWVESQMDDPAVVEDQIDWVMYTPQEPLPRDVSPLMSDENFTIPEASQDLLGLSEGTDNLTVDPTVPPEPDADVESTGD